MMIKIDQDKRKEMMQLVNDLHFALENINEMQDLYMSDVSNLIKLECKLQDILDLKWQPKTYRFDLAENVKENE